MKRLSRFALCILLLSGCAAGVGDGETPSPAPDTAPPSVAAPVPPTETVTPETPSPSFPAPETPEPPPSPTPDKPEAGDPETALAGMSLTEKVSSLFWVAPDQLGGTAYAFTDATARALAETPVSGVVLFRENIRDEAQVRALTAAFRQAGGPGFAVGVDEEGGRVSRLGGVGSFPKTPAMGRLSGEQEVYAAVDALGAALADWGFTVDFAPVCDVLTNPNNTVIGNRAFSADPQAVALLAPQAVKALLAHGVQPCIKHFPGHGGTAGDSHTGAVSLPYDLEHLRGTEWPPFSAALAAGTNLVMVGHIALPAVTGDDTPASLSPDIVAGFLRGELGFDGLVVTDSLRMKAVTDRWPAGEAAVLALKAGCDVLLMPQDLADARAGVLQAVLSGALPEARVDEAVLRRLAVFGW
ncbi:MAG: glycoside hydrolase family 3 protein [Oscillospiraceae bacterium]|jgi:beta-N-acetylhexosaminidase|nr:glycoside hydrolase family 3 protein [Oscillospiraceae bacterium]